MDIFGFLKNCEIKENEKPITHVSYTGGKYHIPIEDVETFLNLYLNQIKNYSVHNSSYRKLYLAECILPGKMFRFMVDLEIKYEYRPETINDNQVETEIIPMVIQTFQDLIIKHSSLEQTEKVLFFLSKRSPYLAHINFTDVIISKKNARILVDEARDIMKMKYPDINWEKSLDSGIYSNGKGLRMLGSFSKKELKTGEYPFYRPYEDGKYRDTTLEDIKKSSIRSEEDDELAKVLDYDKDFVSSENEMDINNDELTEFIEIIRNKISIKGDVIKIKKFYKYNDPYPYFVIDIKDRFCPFVRREHSRKSNYLYIFICKTGAYLKCWDEDCKTQKFPKDSIIKLSKNMINAFYNENIKKVTINNLDKDPAMKEILDKYELDAETKKLVENSMRLSHFDIAKLAHYVYKNKFRTDLDKNRGTWYEFKNHRYYANSNYIRILISEDLSWYFLKYESEIDSGKLEIIHLIIEKLKTVSFKNSVLSEVSDLFYYHCPDFIERLDSNSDLICFNNGVLDTTTMEFRDGRIEDYISLTTKNDYIPYDPKNQQVQEVYKFFRELFPDEEVFNYQLKKIALCLSGKPDENFNIWTGNGCFGKNTQILMYDKSIKLVQDIQLEDELMGDDGSSRKVKQLYTGYSDMYKIVNKAGDFIINGDHDLAVIAKESVFYTEEQENKFKVFWTEYGSGKSVNDTSKNKHSVFIEKYECFDDYQEVIIFMEYLQTLDRVVQKKNKCVINMRDFLKFSLKQRKRWCLYTCDNQLLDFEILHINNDNFYGFELDKNHLFVLANSNIIQANSNGKSKLCDLIRISFGNYWTEVPVALVTKTRANSGNSNPAIMDLKGRRIATIQEPEVKDKLNMGLIKQFTGGDMISARQLYKTQEKFNLQTKLFLCCNAIPAIECSDGGTWRRIKITEFKSKFVDKPTRSHEFKRDFRLEDKIRSWGPAFLSILIHYYELIKTEGIKEPAEVTEFTKEFRKDSDIFTQFTDECLLESKDSYTSFTDIYNRFLNWCGDKNIPSFHKLFTKTELKKLLGDLYGKEKKDLIDGDVKVGFGIEIIEPNIAFQE